MARVYPIDRGIIDRTQSFLMKKMDKDGTWSNIGATHSETIASMGDPKLLLTSYVTWSLLESGLPKDKLEKSIEYIRAHLDDARDNAYILALAANALAAWDAKDDSTLSARADARQATPGHARMEGRSISRRSGNRSPTPAATASTSRRPP